ncbi:MAG: phosphoenolpyruvate carboxykinase [Candidatus Omnitrophota bacterium]
MISDKELEKILSVVKRLKTQANVSRPTEAELRKEAQSFATPTEFGNYNFVSSVKNRSAGLTVYVGSTEVAQSALSHRQKEIVKNLPQTLATLFSYLERAPFVYTKNSMGDNPYFACQCNLFVSVYRKEMVRLSFMVNRTLFPANDSAKAQGPDFYLVYVPEWQEKDRQILVFPEIGVTFVLGTDYYGEAKKGFLRLGMWYAKQREMLGLHAGSKIIYAKDAKTGKIKKYSMLIFGLTATGKTTHSCHDHGLNLKGEGIEIVQDDVVFLCKDGSTLGTERGFYLKTEGVSLKTQPLIYKAATSPHAVFENVSVDYRGKVYFDDDTLTGNGRGIMQRDDFGKFKSKSINTPSLAELDGMIIALITRRNTVVPIAAKLNPEQAAAFFMLGESIESSGSDPKRAGESVREVGTNPFIIGEASYEGNWFYQFLKSHQDKISCFLLNTGGIGEIIEVTEEGSKITKRKVERVAISEMAAIIRGIVRNSIKWTKSNYFNYEVPQKVESIDILRFNLANFYSPEEIQAYLNDLKAERAEYFQKFSRLNPAIINSVQ